MRSLQQRHEIQQPESYRIPESRRQQQVATGVNRTALRRPGVQLRPGSQGDLSERLRLPGSKAAQEQDGAAQFLHAPAR